MEIYYCENNPENSLKETREISYKLLKEVHNIHGIDLDDYIIEKSTYGKPFIRNTDFEYNISHTKGMIACVIGGNVGIDCEKIRHVKNSTINRVCGQSEIDFLNNCSNKDKAFISLWTLKEAYTKMLGSGFRYPFKNVNIENIYCLHNDCKVYQTFIGDIALTAIEENGNNVSIKKLNIV